MTIEKQEFVRLADGAVVDLYTLRNDQGMQIKIMNYGATLTAVSVPDRAGVFDDVTLGFDTFAGWLANRPYFGATIGRYANRIAHGRFTLDGVEYVLAQNNGPNHLHGGLQGFDKVLWQATTQTSADGVSVALSYLSPDGEEGYPGNLQVSVVYTLTNTNAVKIEYRATTDKTTVVNLTNHAYFNLAGATSQSAVLAHEVRLTASRFTAGGPGLIPTGELRAVEGTPFDFTTMTAIGARIQADDEQLRLAGGYDHNWVLDSQNGALALAAEVYEPKTGRVMTVETTEPGIQMYTGNFLNDSVIIGKGDVTYQKNWGFCLETQHFPDSPNHPEFPTTILTPGETYTQTTVYAFSVK